MRRLAFLLPAFVLAFPASLLAEDPALLALEGLALSRVSYQSPAPLPEAEFAEMVPLRAGDALRPSAVREAILTLHRSGRFERIDVKARKAGGEGKETVELLFLLFPRKTLTRVSFTGNLEITDRELSAKVQLRRGEKIDDRALENAAKRLEEYYAYRGFPKASVSFTYGFLEGSPEIELVFAVREGERLNLGEVRVDGDPPLSRGRVLAAIESRLGDHFDGEKAENDARLLTEVLREKGFFFPKVTAVVDRGNPGKGVAVTFRVESGDLIRFGIDGVKAGGQKKLISLAREGLLAGNDPARAISAAEARVREEYLGSGFPFVGLTWEDRREGGTRFLTLVVSEGKRVRLGAITVEGAPSLSGPEVKGALALKEGDPFVRSTLDAALTRLAGIYHERGYLSARASLRPLALREVDGEMAADPVVVVDEGVRTRIGLLSMGDGQGAVSAELLLADLGLRAGDPFVASALARGKEAMLDRLGKEGFLYAKVTVGEAYADSRRSVSLSVRVEPGPRVTTGSLLVTGNRRVDSRIIRLAADLPRGGVLSREKVLEAQKRLYQLGVMESVEVRLADEEQPASVKEVVIDVRERNRSVVGIRLGYSNEELFKGEVSYTHRNLGGMARSLTLLGRGGNRGSLASANFTFPWFLDRPIDFTLSLSDQVDRLESYTKDASTISLLLRRQMSERTVTTLSYSFGGHRLTDVAPGAVLSPEDEGKTTVAFISPEMVYDDRDDKFEPTSGTLVDLRVEGASSLLGSKTEYYRVEGAVRRFLPLGEGFVMGWVARAGLVEAFGKSSEVIISRRLFLGGQNSVRGYALDSLGPLDVAGKPLGGNFLLNLNGELRFPVYKALRGVVFADSGSLWLRSPPHDDRTLRVSAGAGLRWSTPIGPFSLDYARKLNPATTLEDKWYLHFSIGHAF